MNDDNHDPLRDRLRALDPAASLPAADPAGVARLLEQTMDDQHTTESRSDHLQRRSRLTWIVAAAAVVLIGGGVVLVALQGDEAGAPESATAVPSASAFPEVVATETVTELTVAGGDTAGRCMSPAASPQVVAAQSTVFDGVVESISGGTVTLRPTRFYAGEETDLVTVQDPGDDLRALLSAVRFEEGRRYLVAATDGRVTLCGFTDVYTEELAAVYESAFRE